MYNGQLLTTIFSMLLVGVCTFSVSSSTAGAPRMLDSILCCFRGGPRCMFSWSFIETPGEYLYWKHSGFNLCGLMVSSLSDVVMMSLIFFQCFMNRNAKWMGWTWNGGFFSLRFVWQ